MERKQASKLWKGLEAFVSTDKTRHTLCHVHVDAAGIIEATDGFSAVRVTTEVPHGLAPGFYDVKASLARLKAELDPEPLARAKEEKWEFPALARVIPEVDPARESACPSFGMNPRLLGEALGGIVTILGALGAPVETTIRPGASALDPLRIDAGGEGRGAKLVAVVMPMRV